MTVDELLRSSGLPRHEPSRMDPAREANGRRKVYLHAGQLYASDQPTEIVTILGSCVSVCLFDPACAVGGVNHFMLPGDHATVSPRYARHAMDMLVEQLLAFGAKRSRLEAKLFGGASVLKTSESAADLGLRNIEAARVRLAQEKIPIAAEDVGGTRGRRLIYITSDGTALIKEI